MSARLRDAGDAGLLLQLGSTIDPAINARALAVAAAFRQRAFAGVRDVVPTYHSVAVHFDPATADRDALASALEEMATTAPAYDGGALIEVPVTYGGEHGPDLDAVAGYAGLSPRAVIDRHAGREYRVFMLGFMPGFPYMGLVDAAIAAPRRATPRVRVPEGSVGIAGAQTGIYPCTSPGGWQIVGHTPMCLFDVVRPQPATFAAGDRVRFVEAAGAVPPPVARPRAETLASTGPALTVVRPGLFTTIQDGGRWGYQASGVPVAGAMDRSALHVANEIVGNGADEAALEITLLGPELRMEQSSVIAIAGADLGATVDGRAVPLNVAIACRDGSQVRFTGRHRGGRAYLAVRGGLAVPRVLGSRSTDVRAVMGGLEGRALRAGDRVPIGTEVRASHDRGGMAIATLMNVGSETGSREPVTLRVVHGPQYDWFPDEAFERLQSGRFTVQPDSDRMGFRLSSDTTIARRSDEEMISDATFTGALQVPPSGQPILLMADRPTTGGYPQIAVVISADLPRAGQLVPGDEIRFTFCSLAEAQAAVRRTHGSGAA